MMREIKFRAWDGEKLIPLFSVNSQTGEIVYNGIVKDYPLMQYTGLTDKNGVDIYEGDIVTDHVGKGVVKYVDDKGAFRVSYGDGMAKWFTDYNLKGERESIEVIGNIHEHGELLE